MAKTRQKKKQDTNNALIDYKQYRFCGRELCIELLKGIVFLLVTSYLFYGTFWVTAVLSPYLYVHLKRQKRLYKERRQKQLRDEFKEVMVCMVNALYAGYSLENSILYVKKEWQRVHGKEEGLMMTELDFMIRKIQMKVPIEQLFRDLAVRSGVEEIDLFATVIDITKRNGGNLIKIIQKTVEHLSKKVQVDSEIDVLIAGKKLEKNVMCVMPYFVILYMNVTNPHYMSGIYGNAIGAVVMTICLILEGIAYYWADYLIKIEV